MHLYDYDEEEMSPSQAELWQKAVEAEEIAIASWNEYVAQENEDDPYLREYYEERLENSIEAITAFQKTLQA